MLLPGGSPLPNGISHKDDFVTALAGSYEYRFFQTDTWTIGAGGGLFTNFHARLSDFNVFDLAPTLYVERRLGSAQLRLQYTLDYVTVGGDAYLLSNAIQPTLTIPESERTYTQAFFRYQNKDFKSFRDDQLGVPVNQTRDANNYMLGAMQYWRFPDDRGYVRGGYIFDTDQTGGGDAPTNTGSSHQCRLAIHWPSTVHRDRLSATSRHHVAAGLRLLSAELQQSQLLLAGRDSSQGQRLSIDRHRRRDIRSWLWLAFQYSYTRDQSNVDAFNYTRIIVSLTVGGAF